MKIAVQFAGDLPRELADLWYKHLRKHMNHPIVHLTDLTTEPLSFADEVQRIEETDICKAKYKHLAVLKGDILNLDYDIVVQKDVSDVFNRPFDIALTKRTVKEGKYKMLSLSQPHNTGVVFSRNRQFWRLCLERYEHYPDHRWMMGQVCISETANAYREDIKLLELPASLYNYAPKSQDEDLRDRFIVHYKGPRKFWMLNTEKVYDESVRVGLMAQDPKLFYTEDHPNYKEIVAEQKRRGQYVEKT